MDLNIYSAFVEGLKGNLSIYRFKIFETEIDVFCDYNNFLKFDFEDLSVEEDLICIDLIVINDLDDFLNTKYKEGYKKEKFSLSSIQEFELIKILN